jgi:hypothetical protein
MKVETKFWDFKKPIRTSQPSRESSAGPKAGDDLFWWFLDIYAWFSFSKLVSGSRISTFSVRDRKRWCERELILRIIGCVRLTGSFLDQVHFKVDGHLFFNILFSTPDQPRSMAFCIYRGLFFFLLLFFFYCCCCFTCFKLDIFL